MLQNTLPKNHVAFVVYLYEIKLKNSGQLIFLCRMGEKQRVDYLVYVREKSNNFTARNKCTMIFFTTSCEILLG
jgi:hypothetical protein